MPSLECYLFGEDLDLVLSFLNDSSNIAYLLADGPKCWKAVKSIASLDKKKIGLWEVSSGPLPLLRALGESDAQVANPWSGWMEQRTGADPTVPYFGAGHPGIIWFNHQPDRFDSSSKILTIGLSTFGWIGNHYRIIGSPASPTTEKFWKSLRQFAKKNGVLMPRGGPAGYFKKEVWAFPAAKTLFSQGALGSCDPFN